MANSYFQFKQFTVHQDKCAMKVTTDSCLFGAYVADAIDGAQSAVTNCLDIGTGTGLLSLMLAQKNHFDIDAIEIDDNAAVQANINVVNSPFSEKIKIIHDDVKEFQFNKQYDVIISNPPFYEKELKGNDTQKNKAHHNEGLLLSELMNIIRHNLKPGGVFYLLLPYKRNEEIKELITKHEFSIERICFLRQTFDHDFFRIILAAKRSIELISETTFDEMAIKDLNGNYTNEFISLLKDYYLHL